MKIFNLLAGSAGLVRLSGVRRWVAVAIGLTKISAVVGYEYLTRHVAVLDATSKDYLRLDAY